MCVAHGGRAPQVKAAAAQRVVEARAVNALAYRQVKPVTDPVTALTELAGETVALKDFLADRVRELANLTAYDLHGAEQTRAVLGAYERALDRTGRLLVDMSRLGLEGRMVALEARKVAVVFEAVLAALRAPEAGLSPDQVATVRRLLASALRSQAQLEAA